MKKEFVPYEQALKLKELGFNEGVLAQYRVDGYLCWGKDDCSLGSDISDEDYKNNCFTEFGCRAPLWQQAFDWFREKHDLLGYVNDESSVEDNPNLHKKWMYVIQELPVVLHDDLSNDKIYKTYKEAELECLKKLIEIVSNKVEK